MCAAAENRLDRHKKKPRAVHAPGALQVVASACRLSIALIGWVMGTKTYLLHRHSGTQQAVRAPAAVRRASFIAREASQTAIRPDGTDRETRTLGL